MMYRRYSLSEGNAAGAGQPADRDEQGPGWAIVDTGTQTPEVLAAWRQLVAADGILGLDQARNLDRALRDPP